MMSVDIFKVGLYIMIIIIIVMFFVEIVNSIKEYMYNNNQPIVSVFSKVILKSVKLNSKTYVDATLDLYSEAYNYYIWFSTYDDIVVNFEVNVKEYLDIQIDDKGNLIFQGTRFLGFVRKL